jgi:glucosamine--fructose-6-phosphate aminotransferase (isomerizing)
VSRPTPGPLSNPPPHGSRLFAEAAEAPERVAEQLQRNRPAVQALAERLRRDPPSVVVTLGRGSSGAAATFARYLIETRLQVLTSAAAPSVGSLFGATLAMQGALCLAVSQSGSSPDLLASAEAARRGGAYLVVIANDEASPLAQMADIVLPMHAGRETSVAATKTFITSLSAMLQLVLHWHGDADGIASLEMLPGQLRRAWEMDWSAGRRWLAEARGLYVVGRGLNFAAVQEAALKFKETCNLQAEAFSSAELRHGPLTLARDGFPVLVFDPGDEARADVEALARRLRDQGASVMQAGGADGGALPLAPCAPLFTPLVQIQSFYRMIDGLAADRGLDPDRPAYLSKVTNTR